MKRFLGATMEEATRLTRERNLTGATRMIMQSLFGSGQRTPQQPAPQDPGPRIDPGIEAPATDNAPLKPHFRLPRLETPGLLGKGQLPDLSQGVEALAKLRKRPRVIAPDGASYLSRTFAGQAGSRPYKVYVPSKPLGANPPLLVMLHGCTQNADDFAIGTGMNLLAEEHGLIVAYPEQPMAANQLGCWKWFNPQDQLRDQGEPSIIAGITRALVAELNIDSARVFVAGLSAGGAMAEIMSATYPDVYAGAGIHSGVAYGAASDTASAFVAMSGKLTQRRASSARETVRTIIFHGASDRKVHPNNAEAILADARSRFPRTHQETIESGMANGRKYTRTALGSVGGVAALEYWAIEGLGHAWSGGSPEGSHTDQSGPDASREMVRFFLEGRSENVARF